MVKGVYREVKDDGAPADLEPSDPERMERVHLSVFRKFAVIQQAPFRNAPTLSLNDELGMKAGAKSRVPGILLL